MNRKFLSLSGLKWSPSSPGVPTEALYVTPAIESFCWRVEQLVSEGGFALATGYEKKTVIERKRRRPLIGLISIP